MSKSNKKETKQLTPLEVIDQAIEEKTAKLDGLSAEIRNAQNILQQTEPQLFGLHGAINSLKELREKMTK